MFALAFPMVPARAPVPTENDRSVPMTLPPQAGGMFDDVPLPALQGGYRPETQNQVRIEQRLIIRIAPSAPHREEFVPQPTIPVRVRERKMGDCISMTLLAGVRPMSDSRLMLLLRDRRIVGADLQKSCSARDFYLGFYVSQTSDGQLCVKRDQIHSRSGMTCGIEKLRELVPDD